MAKEPTVPVAPGPKETEVISAEAMGMRDTDIQLFKRAQFLATSTIIPAAYQGNPANCYIAVEMAHRMGLSPMFVMNGLYVVHGRPAWESKFLIHLAKSTVLKDLTYALDKTTDPKNWKCVAHAETVDGRHVEGPEISIQMAKDWGWWDKNPIWRNGTELMLRYRAAAWLIKTEFPECAQGLQTKEEEEEIHASGGRRPNPQIGGKRIDDLAPPGDTAAN